MHNIQPRPRRVALGDTLAPHYTGKIFNFQTNYILPKKTTIITVPTNIKKKNIKANAIINM